MKKFDDDYIGPQFKVKAAPTARVCRMLCLLQQIGEDVVAVIRAHPRAMQVLENDTPIKGMGKFDYMDVMGMEVSLHTRLKARAPKGTRWGMRYEDDGHQWYGFWR